MKHLRTGILCLLLAVHCPLISHAKVWHVAVNGHGYTYNSADSNVCNHTSYGGIYFYNLDSVRVDSANPCSSKPTDPYNLCTASAANPLRIGSPAILRSPYPNGDWDSINHCWMQGDGSEQYPWSLDFALSNPPDPAKVARVINGLFANYWLLDHQSTNPLTHIKTYDIPRWIQPGDIILVHGGVYNGRRILVPEDTLYDYAFNPHTGPQPVLSEGAILLVSGASAPYTVTIDAGLNYHNALTLVRDPLYLYTNGSGLILGMSPENVYLVHKRSASAMCASCIDIEVTETSYSPRNLITPSGTPPRLSDHYSLFYKVCEGANYTSPVDPEYMQTNYPCFLNGTPGSGTTPPVPIIVRAAPCERPILDGKNMFQKLNTHTQCPVLKQLSVLELTPTSNDVWVWGLEITNSNQHRYTDVPASIGGLSIDAGSGLHLDGAGGKAIDLIIHDMIGEGISWFGDKDMLPNDGWHANEVTGCIIYNNGWNYVPDPGVSILDRAHGHSIYTHIPCYDCNPDKRKIRNNIMFNSFDDNLDFYQDNARDGASIQNYDVINNIFFNPGTSAIKCATLDSGYWFNRHNIELSPRNKYSKNMNFINNHSFISDIAPYAAISLNGGPYSTSSPATPPFKLSKDNPLNPSLKNQFSYGDNVELGLADDTALQNYTVTGNHFISGSSALNMRNIEYLDFENNEIGGNTFTMEVFNMDTPACYTPGYYNYFSTPFSNTITFDHNTYHFPATGTIPFKLIHTGYPGITYTSKPNRVKYGGVPIEDDFFNFYDWQYRFKVVSGSTGTSLLYTLTTDVNSSMTPQPNTTNLPHDQYSYAHDYEPGVYNIMIYNWGLDPMVNIDLAPLTIPAGNNWEIHNGQNIVSLSSLLASGSGGGTASINTDSSIINIAQPNGLNYVPHADNRFMNRLVPAQSTAPKFIPLVVKFFPYTLSLSKTGNCVDGLMISVNFPANTDPLWRQTLKYNWTTEGGTFPAITDGNPDALNNPNVLVTGSGVFNVSVTVTDANCMSQTYSMQIDCGQQNDDNGHNSPPPPGKRTGITLSPNPFNNTTSLGYSLDSATRVKIELYDETGKLMHTPVNETQGIGYYNYDICGSGYKSGTYTAYIYFDGKLNVRKLIKL